MDTSQESGPQRGAELERLEAFIGDWRIDGRNLEGAEEFAGTEVTGSQKVEWLPGAFFLMQREEVQFGKNSHQTTWITGWDAPRRRYVVHLFDSLGFMRTYDVSVDGQTWMFEGMKERATLVFDEGSDAYRGYWERSLKGRWVPWCEYTATRVH